MKEIKATKNPRIAIAGSVNSSIQTLKKLHEYGLNVVRVLALSPEKAKNVSGYRDLKYFGDQWNYPSTYFEKINDDKIIHLLKEDRIDWFFVVGLSQLIRAELLSVPKYASLGFHPTALPKGRGRGAVAWIILGAAPGAATFFILDKGMDSGDILAQVSFSVTEEDYASDVIEKIKFSIDKALDSFLPNLKAGSLLATPQSHEEATFLGQRKPKDGLIDWNQSAKNVLKHIRATSKPLPGAFSFYNAEKVVIYRATIRNEFTGIPGRILQVNADGTPIIACKQGALMLNKIETKTAVNFKIGNDLENIL